MFKKDTKCKNIWKYSFEMVHIRIRIGKRKKKHFSLIVRWCEPSPKVLRQDFKATKKSSIWKLSFYKYSKELSYNTALPRLESAFLWFFLFIGRILLLSYNRLPLIGLMSPYFHRPTNESRCKKTSSRQVHSRKIRNRPYWKTLWGWEERRNFVNI